MKNIHHHFSKIAHIYRDLRVTDLEPIFCIEKKLRKLPEIKAADIGCGAGRYDLALFRYLDKKLYLYCIDANKEILSQLDKYLTEHKIKNFKAIKAPAENLPLKNNSLDVVLTFNAIHHFNLLDFLKEASRVLGDKGYLFIYTRLRSQNKRNIWGRYFPLFMEKETRLYELDEIKTILRKVLELKIQSIETFKYKRINSLNQLVKQASAHYYSTFSLYNQKEFEQSLDKFKQNIKQHFKGLKNIRWFNANTLFIVRKRAGRE